MTSQNGLDVTLKRDTQRSHSLGFLVASHSRVPSSWRQSGWEPSRVRQGVSGTSCTVNSSAGRQGKPGKVVYTCTPSEDKSRQSGVQAWLGLHSENLHSPTPPKRQGVPREIFLGFMMLWGRRVLVSVSYLEKTGRIKKKGVKEIQKILASEPFSSSKIFNIPKRPA